MKKIGQGLLIFIGVSIILTVIFIIFVNLTYPDMLRWSRDRKLNLIEHVKILVQENPDQWRNQDTALSAWMMIREHYGDHRIPENESDLDSFLFVSNDTEGLVFVPIRPVKDKERWLAALNNDTLESELPLYDPTNGSESPAFIWIKFRLEPVEQENSGTTPTADDSIEPDDMATTDQSAHPSGSSSIR